MVLFTGDLVNNVATELDEFIPILGQIKGKDGVYSVLGNHDYSPYIKWETEEAQEVLASIPDDMTTSDYNIDYLEMINFYKGKLSAEQLLEISEGLTEAKHRERVFSVCTHAFGLANHFYTLGDRERYHQLIDYTLEIGRDIAWNSFGYAGAYYTKTYRQM